MSNSLDDLLTLMRCLRAPGTGCPWDLQQSLESLLPHTLEETYEVVDAIERGDMDNLREELGDLLFQIVFYAQLSDEQQRFNFDDVVSTLVEKLLRRHPHVFPDGTLASAGSDADKVDVQQVKQNWEAIKQQEREQSGRDTEHNAVSVLDNIPTALPALTRAGKLQKRAANVGFDWPDSTPVFAKLSEEIQELQEAIEQRDQQQITAELGDLLFTCVNLSRHLGVAPETALRHANNKFEERFRSLETRVAEKPNGFDGMDMAQLEILWQQAKKAINSPIES